MSEDVFKERVGLDPDDFDDENIQELLQMPNEVKQGLYDSEYDEEGDDWFLTINFIIDLNNS